MHEATQADSDRLSGAISSYNSDEDIAKSGGLTGIRLADFIFARNRGFFTGLDNILRDSDGIAREQREEIQYSDKPRHDVKDYVEFYSQAKFLQPETVYSRIAEKKKLLAAHFPRRFGDKGRQPITHYNDVELGALFADVYRYAQKHVPSEAR